VRLLTHSKNNN
jgi:DNA-binding protein HU-beta